jgi:hypothetical protein
MKFARYVFAIAGIYGTIVLLPLYFSFEKTGADYPPAITHPEFYYGFTGVALAFQLVFLIIASDPIRYRPVMLASVVEKFSFGIAGMVLYSQGHLAGPIVIGAAIDLLLGILFIIGFAKTPSHE